MARKRKYPNFPATVLRLNIKDDHDLMAWSIEAERRHVNINEYVKAAWRQTIRLDEHEAEQQAQILSTLSRIESKIMAAPMTTASTPAPYVATTETEQVVNELFGDSSKMGWD